MTLIEENFVPPFALVFLDIPVLFEASFEKLIKFSVYFEIGSLIFTSILRKF
jgi:hypothetical protein